MLSRALSRRHLRVMLALLCASTGALATQSAPASALVTHPFLSSFGSFAQVQSIAVDQGTGDVYVYDAGAGGGSLSKFNASGQPAKFTALAGEPSVIEGVGGAGEGEEQLAVDNSAGPAHGDIYLANGSRVGIYGADGKQLGELSEAAGAPWGKPCGVAVDSTGAVYVGLYPGHVNRYVPSSSPVKSSNYTSSLWSLTSVCNVGVDGEGNLYADMYSEGPITKYPGLQFSALEVPAVGSEVAGDSRTLAVDPSNNDLYAAHYAEVEQIDSSGAVLGAINALAPNAFANVRGVAVDGANGDVYLADDEHSRIDLFGPAVVVPDVTVAAASGRGITTATLNGTVNPDGVAVTNCEFEYGTSPSYGSSTPCVPHPGSGSSAEAVTAHVSGLEQNTVYYYRLKSANANGANFSSGQEFTTLSLPMVDNTWSANVGVSTATLGADINPQEAATSYRFEYGTSPSYGTSAPLPAAAIGAGTSNVKVALPLAGLQAATSYHYRVVATSAEGTTDGPDHVLKTFTAEAAEGEACPNAAIRGAQSSSFLPDCRAYEMVSPVNKNGANIAADASFAQSSLSGDAIKYYSTTAFGDAQGIEQRGAEYVSQRGGGGWTTHGINPVQSSAGLTATYTGSQYQYLSPDLSKGVYFALTPVTAGHPDVEHVANLYLRNDILSGPPGNYELLDDCPVCGSTPLPARPPFASSDQIAFAGASADLGRIFFESTYKLTPEAAATNAELPKLYEWDHGAVHLAGILPNGEPAEGSAAGDGAGGGENLGEGNWTEDAISSDGTRAVFTAGAGFRGGIFGGPESGNLYMRIDGTETIQLNESERSVPDPNGAQPATFWAATRDGSRVFFTTKEMLTDDSPENAENVYMYNTAALAGHRLTLISVDSEPGGVDGNAGTVSTAVTGISADGSYVYFVDSKRLVPGQPPFTEEFAGRVAEPGALFVWHEGTVRYIASRNILDDGSTWGEGGRLNNTNFRVDPSGLQATFTSNDAPTASRAGYENEACELASSVVACDEVYVYDYTTNKLVCASCDPTSAAPLGNSGFSLTKGIDSAFGFPFSYTRAQYINNALSEDGRYVFFDTVDPLVLRDTNHRRDVYEYDTVTGQVHLISSGTCACDSLFVDASPDGKNVFFATQQQLVRADVDTNEDLYDARVDGGIEAQNSAPPASCEGDDCQGPAGGVPTFAPPSSATFAGPGNSSPLAVHEPTKVKRKVKPKRHKAKHRKARHHKARKSGRSSTRRAAAAHTTRGVS